MAKRNFSYERRVRDALGALADTVSRRRDGIIVIRRGYFYTHGKDSEDYQLAVADALKKAGILYSMKDYGDVYRAFRGGAPLKMQSHWFVELWPPVDRTV